MESVNLLFGPISTGICTMRTLAPLLLLAGLSLLTASEGSAADAKPPLARVLLLGDSIRMGYAPGVAQRLEGRAQVISPAANGADTAATLQQLDAWLADAKPDVVHFNCGLHDLKVDRDGKKHQVPLDQYEQNLRAIVAKLRAVTPHVVFANTTPILDERHTGRKASFDRVDADVQKYNATAVAIMKSLAVPVDDLNRIVRAGDIESLLKSDGTHYTDAGNERLADAVADVIGRQLYLMAPTRRPAPAAGLEAVAAYRKNEAEGDAQVPEYFRTLKVPAMPQPRDAADWQHIRPDVRQNVIASLGNMPARPAPPTAELVSAEIHPEFSLERLRLPNGLDGVMSAMIMIPAGLQAPAPTILWLHSSSYDHRQLLQPNSNGGAEPLGLTLIKRGYVVFAPDAAFYGDRIGQGPSGSLAADVYRDQQSDQHKFHLWFGRTLWGMFVRDDQCALDYLCTRREVDPKRIGATGISMGSTRSWWLAAVDERIAAVVGVACLTRYEDLIHHGNLRAHGVYYFVFGLLKHFDTEAVVSLIAPRPALFLTGELDAGSPADGIIQIEKHVEPVYATLASAEKFRSIRYPDVGHTYTPEIRRQTLAWFDRWLLGR
jgi:lysophospholipase L1-like esterase/dienelactone hydrolase